jgi:signal transduction histidine kinase
MPGGGILSIRSSLSQIGTETGQELKPAVCITIVDTGLGMPPKTQSRVFEPFFTTRPHGSGLGLSISCEIIQAHNGQISVESQEDKGTTFTIKLPINEPDGSAAAK